MVNSIYGVGGEASGRLIWFLRNGAMAIDLLPILRERTKIHTTNLVCGHDFGRSGGVGEWTKVRTTNSAHIQGNFLR